DETPSSPASRTSREPPASQRLITHGDGVMDIALDVPDVRGAFEAAVARGATPVRKPEALEDEYGVFETASIRAYGDTTHSFVNRDRYRGVFAPGVQPLDP